VDGVTEVALRAASGGGARLRLCGPCYSGAYRSLARTVEGVAEQADQTVSTLIVQGAASIPPRQ
jgi:hypothetical protein